MPIVEEERRRIEKFLNKHPSIRIRAKQKSLSLECVFRDNEKGCLIYSARPKICRAYMCSSTKWTKEFKKPSGSVTLINECFGNATNKEAYRNMLKEILPGISKIF